MAVFQVGVEITKTVGSVVIVRLEADSEASAESAAVKIARDLAFTALTDDDLGMGPYSEWDTDAEYQVQEVSEDKFPFEGRLSFNADIDRVTTHTPRQTRPGDPPREALCRKKLAATRVAEPGTEPTCERCRTKLLEKP